MTAIELEQRSSIAFYFATTNFKENRTMAQIYDGINENPLRQAIYRINWTLRGNLFYGTCPNDALFRNIISREKEGTFTYRCGRANKLINFTATSETTILWMKLDDRCDWEDLPERNSLNPQLVWLKDIEWHIKGEELKGTCPDDALFRGVVPDAYPENDLYPTKGGYLYEWDNAKKRITWFRDDDCQTGKSRIVLILPLYFEEEKPIELLTDKQLKRFKLDFDRFLRKNQCYFDKNSLNRFQYSLVETGQLTSEQAEQLWNYLEAAYK